MNYFDSPTSAAQYKAGRPFYHDIIMNQVKETISQITPFPFAVDIGCGTGLSSKAVSQIATQVLGVDSSFDIFDMVALADPDPNIVYGVSMGEDIPVQSQSVDLITISSALHWLQKEKFLAEANRIIKPNGWMVTYNNYVQDDDSDGSVFYHWYKSIFLKNYPSPPREKVYFDDDSEHLGQFSIHAEKEYQYWIQFSKEQFVTYLFSVSNLLSPLLGENIHAQEIRQSLLAELNELSDANQINMKFGGPVNYLLANK